MNATSKGENMTWRTFKQAIAMSTGYVCLGGGEPTMHPQFEKFLLHAIANTEDEGVFIITNGKITERAIMLAKLAKSGVIGADLSQDEWHDEIDSEVIQAFTPSTRPPVYDRSDRSERDRRSIRRITSVMRRGRAASDVFNSAYETFDRCTCEGDAFVKQNGDVRHCGCEDAPVIGNVFDGWEEPEEWNCHKNIA
jgi:MoaA/NifB/PqqE/SkfB family radical SAM enzyme